MKRITYTLPIAAGVAMVVAAWTFVGSASAQDAAATAAATSQTTTVHNHVNATVSPTRGVSPTPTVKVSPTPSVKPTVSPGTRPVARTPEELLKLLGERIVSKDLEGIIALQEPEAAIVNYDLSVIRGHQAIRAFYADWFTSDPKLTVNPGQILIAGGTRSSTTTKIVNRTASIMGTYSLEQTAPDGTRESFSGNFCDIVREQPNGTWLYVQDNPYPPHH